MEEKGGDDKKEPTDHAPETVVSITPDGPEATAEEAKETPKSVRKQSLNNDSTLSSDGIPSKKPKVHLEDTEDSALETPLEQCPVAGPSAQSPTSRPLARSPIKAHSGVQTTDQEEKSGSTESTKWARSIDIIYQVKWVDHGGKRCPVVTQNENGPCPLIAVVNVLYLRRKLSLPEGTLEISEDDLVEQVHLAIMDTMPKDTSIHNPNHLQNLQDALVLLPQLRTGLNVNVKFTGVKSFEYTPECIIFDVLNIPLYHGWLMDPQSTEVVSAIGHQSYNQLVEDLIEKKSCKNADKVAQALVAENFLEATASQLTVHGLCELNASLDKGELAVLFRNNHFIVLHKHENILCQLVTDQGFLEEPEVVWETLSTINGDETFLNGAFRSSIAKANTPSLHPSEEQLISRDFLVALSLQDEQNKQQDKEFGWDAYGNALGGIGMTSDEELARQLHVEEQRMAQVSASRASTPLTPEEAAASAPPSPLGQSLQGASKETGEPPKPKDWKCCIS